MTAAGANEPRRESERDQWRKIDDLAIALSKLATEQEVVAVELRNIREYMARTDKRLDRIDNDVRALDNARNRMLGMVAGVGLASGAGGSALTAIVLKLV